MFYVDGWTPLREVSLTVSRRRVREHGEQLKIHGVGGADRSLLTRSGTCGEVWEICANALEVGVLLSNGVVVTASRDLVRDEPPHLNWSTVMFRKRRIENGQQTAQARRDSSEVTTG